MDDVETTLIGIVAIGALICLVAAIELTMGRTPSAARWEVPEGRDPPAADDRWGDGAIDLRGDAPESQRSPPMHESCEWTDLIDVNHLRGMDTIEELLAGLADAVVEATRRPRRRPRRPTSLLLHGPPGGAMIILAHVFARTFRARLVHVFASRTIAMNNGGSQPLIAVAVNEARDRLPSVLLLDELDLVAAAEIRDPTKLRAANDLVNESLRPCYGASHVVIATFTTEASGPPQALQHTFEHVVRVDVPELERALVRQAVRTTEHELFRRMPAHRLANRADVSRNPPYGRAA